MSYSPPLGAYQIDVVDQTGRAYRTALDNARLIVEMALLPLLIMIGAELVALLVRSGGFIGHIVGALIEMIGFLVFGTIFIVRWHRFVLLDESVSGGLIPPGWGPFFVAGLKVGGLVVAGWIILVFVAILPPHFLTIPLTAVGGIALTLFAMRVSLIFPAAAIERPARLMDAWQWVTGNFWRLFVCLVACYLPFAFVQFVLIAIGAALPSLLWIVIEVARLIVVFAGTAVVAALLSQLYREIVGRATAASPA
jgi:hypothetical protein